MFTGIIEERGILQEVQRNVNCAKVTIQAKKVLEEKTEHEMYDLKKDEIIQDNPSPKKEGSHK